MPYTQTLSMSADDQHRLLEWWNATESAKVVVRHLVSLVSELRLHPESSHADGMVLFYRAVSEISYGYAGIRGCIRRAFSGDTLMAFGRIWSCVIVLPINIPLTQKCFLNV